MEALWGRQQCDYVCSIEYFLEFFSTAAQGCIFLWDMLCLPIIMAIASLHGFTSNSLQFIQLRCAWHLSYLSWEKRPCTSRDGNLVADDSVINYPTVARWPPSQHCVTRAWSTRVGRMTTGDWQQAMHTVNHTGIMDTMDLHTDIIVRVTVTVMVMVTGQAKRGSVAQLYAISYLYIACMHINWVETSNQLACDSVPRRVMFLYDKTTSLGSNPTYVVNCWRIYHRELWVASR